MRCLIPRSLEEKGWGEWELNPRRRIGPGRTCLAPLAYCQVCSGLHWVMTSQRSSSGTLDRMLQDIVATQEAEKDSTVPSLCLGAKKNRQDRTVCPSQLHMDILEQSCVERKSRHNAAPAFWPTIGLCLRAKSQKHTLQMASLVCLSVHFINKLVTWMIPQSPANQLLQQGLSLPLNFSAP